MNGLVTQCINSKQSYGLLSLVSIEKCNSIDKKLSLYAELIIHKYVCQEFLLKNITSYENKYEKIYIQFHHKQQNVRNASL